jgi:hypothetical protein
MLGIVTAVVLNLALNRRSSGHIAGN